MSDFGQELRIHGLEEYQKIKQVNINLQPGTIGWYTKNYDASREIESGAPDSISVW